MTRILIVEDEMIVAEDIKSTLESLGYSVMGICSTGEDATRTAMEKRPDLILMDVKLNGRMTGIEAAEKIAHLNIPIIFLTAYANEAVLGETNSSRFGYIVKPFEEKNLDNTIKAVLQKYRNA
jgi:CheY-like chemotaxis protein